MVFPRATANQSASVSTDGHPGQLAHRAPADFTRVQRSSELGQAFEGFRHTELFLGGALTPHPMRATLLSSNRPDSSCTGLPRLPRSPLHFMVYAGLCASIALRRRARARPIDVVPSLPCLRGPCPHPPPLWVRSGLLLGVPQFRSALPVRKSTATMAFFPSGVARATETVGCPFLIVGIAE
jgi:hypothetical protein